MGTLTDPTVHDYIEFRTGVDLTVELFCRLCGRAVFELHADSAKDGPAIAREHLRRVHQDIGEDRHG